MIWLAIGGVIAAVVVMAVCVTGLADRKRAAFEEEAELARRMVDEAGA